MNDTADESDEDIADDVLPVTVELPAVPIKLDSIQPWHRPRKQVIREQQWVMFSARLIDRIKDTPALRPGLDGIREVRYLTLPGIDYLDVRLLADVCRDLDCVLTTTGFLAEQENTPVRARAQFREDSLVKAKHITDQSTTLSQRFEEISSESSQAYRDIRSRGPFHIVNVDACGSIALPKANHAQRMIDAIFKVVELQLNISSHRWLMFLTADVRKDNIEPDTLANLSEAIHQNARDNEVFRTGASNVLAEEGLEIEAAVAAAMSADGPRFLRLFALGFAKWLLHLAGEKQWNLKMHNSYCYSTSHADEVGPTMPCLAFEFVPPNPGLRDRFQVANAAPAAGGVEQDLSLRAIEKVREMQDLDEKLKADHNLRSEMIEKTKNLLAEAGYAASALVELDALRDPAAG